MAETVNTGLGEAISEQTNLQGNWGNPITQGLQINQRNEFQRLQQEQVAANKLAKQAEDMAKYATIDEGKFDNPEYARKAHTEIQKAMPLIMNAQKAGDYGTASKIKNEAIYKVGMYKTLDRDESFINKLPKTSPIKGYLQETYSKKGLEGFQEHNYKYPFAPIADIDEESGSFKIRDVANPNLNRKMAFEVDRNLGALVADKNSGVSGSSTGWTINKDSQGFKNAKIQTINKMLSDDNLIQGVMYTQGFRDAYDDYIKKAGIDYSEATQEDLNLVMQDYLGKQFDLSVAPKVKYTTPRSSGSTNNNYSASGRKSPWNLDVIDSDGYTLLETYSPTAAKPTFESIDGTTFKNEHPKAKYLGNGVFEVIGSVETDYGFEKLPPVKVSKEQIKSVLDLNEEGLAAKFKGYKPVASKGGASVPKSGKSKWESAKRK